MLVRAAWFLNRVAAAIVGAALIGVAAAFFSWTASEVSCRGAVSRCGDPIMGLVFVLMWTPLFSVVLGTLPGVVALTLTPAKEHPWRSLAALVPASLLGFAIWWYTFGFVGSWRHLDDGLTLYGMMLGFPTLTGLIVAFNINRLPMRWLHPAPR